MSVLELRKLHQRESVRTLEIYAGAGLAEKSGSLWRSREAVSEFAGSHRSIPTNISLMRGYSSSGAVFLFLEV